MIRIRFDNSWIDADNNGTPLAIPSYWDQNILNQIDQAFADGDYEVIPNPEPIGIPVVPNWLRFYKALKVSATFSALMNLTVLAPNISGVMAAMGIAIQGGICDLSDTGILPAFQASVDGVIAALNAINQPLNNEQLTEVRTLLDNNGFDNIQLGG